MNFRADFAFDLTPNASNTYDVGSSSQRVRTFYAVNALDTSFSKFKRDIVKLDDMACMGICSALDTIEFKWNPDVYVSNGTPEDEILANRKYVGYNADALKTMLPNAVQDDMMFPQAVIGVLLGAVRHLQERILQLEA